MIDFTIIKEPTGTLYRSETQAAKKLVAKFFLQLADPILDDIGAEIFDELLAKGGFTVVDKRDAV